MARSRGSSTNAVGASAAGTDQMQQCGRDCCWSIFPAVSKDVRRLPLSDTGCLLDGDRRASARQENAFRFRG